MNTFFVVVGLWVAMAAMLESPMYDHVTDGTKWLYRATVWGTGIFVIGALITNL